MAVMHIVRCPCPYTVQLHIPSAIVSHNENIWPWAFSFPAETTLSTAGVSTGLSISSDMDLSEAVQIPAVLESLCKAISKTVQCVCDRAVTSNRLMQ